MGGGGVGAGEAYCFMCGCRCHWRWRGTFNFKRLARSLPQAMIMTSANSIDLDETAHKEPSHLDLRCLTFSLSTLHINFFPSDSLLKNKKQTTNVVGNLALKVNYFHYFLVYTAHRTQHCLLIST